MKKASCFLAVMVFFLAGCRSMAPVRSQNTGVSPSSVSAAAPAGEQGEPVDLPGIGGPSAGPVQVRDPLEPVNRAFFHFNDKLYFWVLKPAARGYNYAVPETARVGVRNFFSNVTTPVRLVNCLLQARPAGAWVELERFGINTTVGVAGFGDPAKNRWNLERRREDLGQTLGVYGVGPAIYINWPILGPSSLRDSVGYVGDLFLDPVNYLVTDIYYNLGVKSYDTVNVTSLHLGEYEDFEASAIDPYVAMRDAYYQYRRNLIGNAGGKTERIVTPVPRE